MRTPLEPYANFYVWGTLFEERGDALPGVRLSRDPVNAFALNEMSLFGGGVVPVADNHMAVQHTCVGREKNKPP